MRPGRWCAIAVRALEYARIDALTTGDRDRAQRLALLLQLVDAELELYPDKTTRPAAPSTGITVGWYRTYDPHIRSVCRALGIDVPEPGSHDRTVPTDSEDTTPKQGVAPASDELPGPRPTPIYEESR